MGRGEFNNVYKAQKVGNIIPSSIYTRPSKDYPFFPAWVPSGKVEKAYNISRPLYSGWDLLVDVWRNDAIHYYKDNDVNDNFRVTFIRYYAGGEIELHLAADRAQNPNKNNDPEILTFAWALHRHQEILNTIDGVFHLPAYDVRISQINSNPPTSIRPTTFNMPEMEMLFTNMSKHLSLIHI